MQSLITIAVAMLGILMGSLFLIKEDVRTTPETYKLVAESIQNETDAVERFAKALSYPTVGNSDATNHISDPAPFQYFHTHLEDSFPAVFKALKVERVNEYSLLMTWPGSDPDLSLNPLILLSHLDVVPASPHNWTYPPFSGTIADGFVWGRGAMDTKSSLLAMLEAVSQLLAAGFVPRRPVILAFGHDEELGGAFGAGKIAELLESRGMQAELLIDEGGLIQTDGVTIAKREVIKGQLAVIGLATKGFEQWKIHINGDGGHSSMPPTGQGSSVAAIMSKILARIENNQTPTKVISPTTEFLKGLASAVTIAPLRTLLRMADNRIINLILGQIIGALPMREFSAMVRTTVAVVRVEAGVGKKGAHNVIPEYGSIALNFRTLPEEDPHMVKDYIHQLIQKESHSGRARAEKLPSSGRYKASSVTPAGGPHYDLIARAIMETLSPSNSKDSSSNSDASGVAGEKASLENTVPFHVVPMLIVGGTDALWYENIAYGRIFRFNPLRVSQQKGDLKRIHGIDERVKVEDYLDGVRFYMRVIHLAAGDAEAQ